MEPSEYSFDLRRIFLGDFPFSVYGEILLRTIFMYLFAVLIIRLVGKRGAGQLSILDIILIIGLGSAVGDPMFYPSVPLFHGMLVITLVVLMQRSFQILTGKTKAFHRLLESEPRLIVKSGKIVRKALNSERLSEEDLKEELREKGVEYLENVRKAYLEPSGHVSVYKYKGKKKKKRDIKP